MIPSLVLGSGAWIWTLDLWVMMFDPRGPVAWPGQLSGREHPTPS